LLILSKCPKLKNNYIIIMSDPLVNTRKKQITGGAVTLPDLKSAALMSTDPTGFKSAALTKAATAISNDPRIIAATAATDAGLKAATDATAATDAGLKAATAATDAGLKAATDVTLTAAQQAEEASRNANIEALITKEKNEQSAAAESATAAGTDLLVQGYTAPVVEVMKQGINIATSVNSQLQPTLKDAAETVAEAKIALETAVDTATLNAIEAADEAEYQTHKAKHIDTADTKEEFLEKRREQLEKIKAEAKEEKKEEEEEKAKEEAEEKKGGKGGKKWWFSGGDKPFSLNQIQKGGRQSAKRTKKSINEFLNSPVTSSQILNMIAKSGDDKRKTKIKRKRNSGRVSKKVKIRKGNK
jgi:hypothetical protein